LLFKEFAVIHRDTVSAEYTSEPDPQPTVFVVDDDVSVREALELLIRCAGWRPALFESAHAFLSHTRVKTPRCLVLDLTLPDLDGLELQKRIAMEQRQMPIIFITGYSDVRMTVRAMKAGAFEFLTKPFVVSELSSAIERAIERSRMALFEDAALQSLHERYSSLSTREREVMSLVVSGLLNKQIGGVLGISEITVKAHRGNVMRKMMAFSLADLVKMDTSLPTAAQLSA
jgi:FixJ family two-component response regulator